MQPGSSVVCDDLEGWGLGVGERLNQGVEDFCIHTADSCYAAETIQHCKATILN